MALIDSLGDYKVWSNSGWVWSTLSPSPENYCQNLYKKVLKISYKIKVIIAEVYQAEKLEMSVFKRRKKYWLRGLLIHVYNFAECKMLLLRKLTREMLFTGISIFSNEVWYLLRVHEDLLYKIRDLGELWEIETKSGSTERNHPCCFNVLWHSSALVNVPLDIYKPFLRVT